MNKTQTYAFVATVCINDYLFYIGYNLLFFVFKGETANGARRQRLFVFFFSLHPVRTVYSWLQRWMQPDKMVVYGIPYHKNKKSASGRFLLSLLLQR